MGAADLELTEVPRIGFRTNPRKALEVILWCAAKRRAVDFHTVLKVLFYADVTHLNRWGRPIVGDDYKALDYGPVPQTTYDLMKREPLALSALGMDDVPFTVERGHHVVGHRPPDLSLLSESDIEALEEGWHHCAHLGFGSRTDLSHRHPAWKRAWSAGRQTMLYADFLEGENATPERIRDLAEIAPDLRL